jgi:nucleoside-diphosphate-sugar epimerase
VEGCDYIVNCAAARSAKLRSADEYRLTNEVGVETLLRAAVDPGVRRVVHCSTAVSTSCRSAAS